jgi:hypothetical protein
MKPRNPMGIHVHKRKAGAHKKTEKAVRRQERMATQREAGRVARHLAFNQHQDGFESLASHQRQQTHGDRPGPLPAGFTAAPTAASVASRLLFDPV